MAADGDGALDIYERSGGGTTLISGPAAGSGSADIATYSGNSADGNQGVLPQRRRHWSPPTATKPFDVYERAGGVTTLISTGPAGGNGGQPAFFAGAGADGSRVFFETDESLVAADTDVARDVYVSDVEARRRPSSPPPKVPNRPRRPDRRRRTSRRPGGAHPALPRQAGDDRRHRQARRPQGDTQARRDRHLRWKRQDPRLRRQRPDLRRRRQGHGQGRRRQRRACQDWPGTEQVFGQNRPATTSSATPAAICSGGAATRTAAAAAAGKERVRGASGVVWVPVLFLAWYSWCC